MDSRIYLVDNYKATINTDKKGRQQIKKIPFDLILNKILLMVKKKGFFNKDTGNAYQGRGSAGRPKVSASGVAGNPI